jgi:hypothetical protein
MVSDLHRAEIVSLLPVSRVAALVLVAASLGCGSSGESEAASASAGPVLIFEDTYEGNADDVGDPTKEFVKLGSVVDDGDRLIVTRGGGIGVLPLTGAPHGPGDLVFLRSGGIHDGLLSSTTHCILGSHNSAVQFHWIMERGSGTVATIAIDGYPQLLQDDVLYWAEGESYSPQTVKAAPLGRGCSLANARTLGQLPSHAQSLEVDATNIYASIWDEAAKTRQTYAIPLTGGPTTRLPEARRDLGSFPDRRTTPRPSLGAFEYAVTRTDRCIEEGQCQTRGPPGSTAPCCKRRRYVERIMRTSIL